LPIQASQGGRWLGRIGKPRFCKFEHTSMLKFADPKWWVVGKEREANSNTRVLKLVELRVAGGWPRLKRLGFINSGTCMLKFTEPRWQVGRWLDKGEEALFSKLEHLLCNQEMK